MESGEVSKGDDFVRRIHQKVEEANRNTEVTEIMTIEEELKVRWDWGYREGETAGLEKGEAIGLKKGESMGIKKGESIGLERGRSEGEAMKQREIAKAMKGDAMPLAKIAALTGLTVEEVKTL